MKAGPAGGRPGFAAARALMVQRDLVGRGIVDEGVLAAFGDVPREAFVSAGPGDVYGDYPLPIGGGQTISQPYIVALMMQSLALGRRDRVLEVGAGSGYQAALLARVAGDVYALERRPELVRAARSRLRRLGVGNVRLRVGDGALGWPAHAPYDAIIVSAACARVPPALVAQLASPGGRLVAPVGGAFHQDLVLLRRAGGSVEQTTLCGCRFVPLISRHPGGQSEEGDDGT